MEETISCRAPEENYFQFDNTENHLDGPSEKSIDPVTCGTDIKSEIVSLSDYDALCVNERLEEEPSDVLLNGCRSSFDLNFIEKKYFSCAFCSYKTKYKYNLIRHVKTHDKLPCTEAKFKCDKCPFESEQNSALQRHLKVHSDTYYQCAHCDFVTKYKESLPKHLLRHKSPSQCKMYICDECEYETKEKISLKRHMLTHRRLEDVEHFTCTYCNFVTKHQLSFNNHILKIHNKDKTEKHKCPECDFSTYHKISLKSHILTHRKPGEVPMYKCPECPYETKNKQFLPNHMKRHMGNVPCPKCKKMICQRGMPLHLKSHETGDSKKKYKCKQCDYGTLYYGNLSRHMKIMHSNKEDINYKQCPECPFKTFENGFLRVMAKAQPNYNVPSRNYFSVTVIPQIYAKCKQKISEILEESTFISITSDMWTSQVNKKSFISLTVHWISSVCGYKHAILHCKSFDGSHTGEVICETMKELYRENNINKENIHLLLRDSGLNIKKACNLMQINH